MQKGWLKNSVVHANPQGVKAQVKVSRLVQATWSPQMPCRTAPRSGDRHTSCLSQTRSGNTLVWSPDPCLSLPEPWTWRNPLLSGWWNGRVATTSHRISTSSRLSMRMAPDCPQCTSRTGLLLSDLFAHLNCIKFFSWICLNYP